MRKRVLTGIAVLMIATPAFAADVPQNDILNATYWAQISVEYKANSLGAYRLAEMRLDQALADKSWTAYDAQSGKTGDLPPAVILDLDETVLDNSPYEAWLVRTGNGYSGKTWTPFCNAMISRAIPGSLEFTKYADSKGVKVFYVSNRKADVEEATRKNMEKLGYPMGGNVDTFLLRGKKDEWKSSAKSPRWAYIAKDYRVLLMVGDNLGDFDDAYSGSVAERHADYEKNAAKWGKSWIMIANPEYGSWESAAFNHDYKHSADEQRQMKLDGLQPWQP